MNSICIHTTKYRGTDSITGVIEIAGILNSKKDIIITSDQSINIYTPESVEEEKATESNSSPESNSNSESNNYFYANNIDINAGKKVEIAVQSMGAKNNLNITANDLVSDTAKQGGIRFAKNININVANGTYKALNKVQYIAEENIDIKATTVSIQGADSNNRVELNVNKGKLSILSQSVDIDNAFLGTKKNIQITTQGDVKIGKEIMSRLSTRIWAPLAFVNVLPMLSSASPATMFF
jgi:hypothetical protein